MREWTGVYVTESVDRRTSDRDNCSSDDTTVCRGLKSGDGWESGMETVHV